jgi:hypothetical protein
VKGFDGYMFLMPSDASRHGDDVARLRAIAEMDGLDGWLLGGRDDRRLRRGDDRPRRGGRRSRSRVFAMPLAAVGTQTGTIDAALAAASTLHGVTDVLAPPPAGLR